MAPEAVKIEYLYVTYLRTSKPLVESDLDNFRSRLIKVLVRFLSIVARIDVCGKWKSLETGQRGTRGRAFLGIKWLEHSQWWKSQARNWASNLILTLYLLFSAHLMINMVYQYAYDFNKLRVARLRVLVRHQLVSSKEFTRLSIIFLDRADESRQMLLLIGAPHKQFNILIECLYLYLVTFGIIMYYISFIYYRIVTPYDFHFVRELLDFENEWRHSNALIQWEVSRFIQSDRNFCDIELEKPRWLADGSEPASLQRLLAHKSGPFGLSSRRRAQCAGERGRWQELTRNDYRVHEVLMCMLTSGALRPYNKSAHWVERRIEMTYVAFGGIGIFAVLFSFTLMSAAFYQRDKSHSLSANELAMLVSTIGLITIISLSSILTSSTFFIGAVDQLAMVEKMRELILACRRQNEAYFDSLVRLRSAQVAGQRAAEATSSEGEACGGSMEEVRLESSCVDAMNTNLLFVFLQYKIFIGQYWPNRKTFQAVIVFAIALIMLIPLIIKLHIPYLNLSNYNNARWFAITVSPAILLPANFVLLPVCHLDAQFVNLFRIWSSLIAHIHQTESHPLGRGLYDRHSVQLMLREIRLTFQFGYQARLAATSLRSTYTTLVKAHFWWGIAVLAILADDLPTGHIGADTPNSLFNDPFSVFSRANFLAV